MSNGRLIILAGPSCVGKSPLDKALARFHPELRAPLRPVVSKRLKSAKTCLMPIASRLAV